MKGRTQEWWKEGVIYQIYPRSFMDSDGNGIGDLPGISSKLAYLQDLGITAIWISPFYPSPMADFGYDISAYTGVDPLFGDLRDFDQLLGEVHQRKMKLILDLVPNHTSDEHPWFVDSRSARDHPKRDWYLWKDPAPGGGPPNNWLSVFGGSAWEWDQGSGQYYYHAFHRKQPDLNWRNPEVEQAMHEVMHFWLKRGVDGFRVDVMWHLVKDAHLRDDPPNPDYREDQADYNKQLPVFSTDQPEVHGIVRRMRGVTDTYEDRLLIGEIYLPLPRLVAYYGENGSGAHLPFNFQLMHTPWDATHIEAVVNEYEAALPEHAWPNWVLGNHDQSRICSRVGKAQARIAALLLLTLRGTPTLYYGDEIGMRNVKVPPELARDPQQQQMPGKELGRDPFRTPMQWEDTPQAGFTRGSPWLPFMPDHREVNVAVQKRSEDSLLALYRRLIRWRNREPALNVGEYISVYTDNNIFSYIRSASSSRYLVILNLGDAELPFTPSFPYHGEVVIASDRSLEGNTLKGKTRIPGNTGIIVKMEPN